MTLGSGKPLPQLFPTLAAANLEQGLKPEFHMCIKKFNKKDPITRAKVIYQVLYCSPKYFFRVTLHCSWQVNTILLHALMFKYQTLLFRKCLIIL